MKYIHMTMQQIPDLEKLRTFYMLARTGSFSEAAKRILRTQSAVSHAILKLEASLDLKLFVRQGRTNRLTEEGRRLYKACESVFHTLDAAFEDLSRRRDRSLGRLRLGSTVEFGCSILMKHIQPFVRDHPQVELDFFMSHDLLAGLLKDDLDMIIDCREHHLPELKMTPMFREAYNVACSPAYKKTHGLKKPTDLGRCSILSLDKEGTWWNRFILSLPTGQRPTLDKIITINHIRGMIVAAQHHLGAILVPRYSILLELGKKNLVSLFPKLQLLEDRFSIYQKKNKVPLKRQRLLTNYLKSIKPTELGSFQ
jgi:DNA-binding transcriptional LysR family regulator